MPRRFVVAVLLSMIAGLLATPALAQSLDELQQSFRARYPRLLEAKRAGKIGETAEGYVDAVKSDSSVSSLVGEENSDRRKLYVILAQKENTTPEKVAERNAARNFSKADPGEWLKGRDGRWTQKR